MGFFDFLRKRREERERIRQEEERERAERAEASRQERERRRQKKAEERRKRMEERRKVSYERIHFWVESRIGILEDLDENEIESRLQELLATERRKNTAPRLHGNMNYDPYAGLEAYILTNSYRKMLEGSAQTTELILETTETGDRDGGGRGNVPRGGGSMPEKEETPGDPRLQALVHKHPSYGRLQYWIEQRIGPMDRLTGDEIHIRLLELLAEERSRNPPRPTQNGGMYDPTSGLEAYIRSKAYLGMLDARD